MAKNTMVLKTKETTALSGPVLTATTPLGTFAEGDKLTTDKVQVEYATLFAEHDDKAGNRIDLPSTDVLTVVRSVDADNHAAWELRSERLWDAHSKAHPVADMSLSIPDNVKDLAAEADDEFGSILFEFVDASKKTKYGKLLVMHELERCFESSIDLWPPPDNDTEEGKPKENKNYKWNGGIPAYDRGYRTKPKGEKGVPSWYSDWFDSLPDLGGHKMGLTIAAEIRDLEKARDKATTQADRANAEDSIADRRKERTAAITLIKGAMKLRGKLKHIGPIVMEDVTIKDKMQKVRAKAEGFDNFGFVIRIDPRTQKIMRTLNPIALQDVGTPEPMTKYVSVGQLLAMAPETLEPNATLQNLLDSAGTGNQEDGDDSDNTSSVFKDVEKEAFPALMRMEASLSDPLFYPKFLHAIRQKNRKTKVYENVPLVETCLSIYHKLDDMKAALDDVKAEADRVAARKLTEQHNREVALRKAHDSAA